MSNRFDRKTQRALLKAMERAKEYHRKLEEKREQRLWKEIDLPAKLLDTLNNLSKTELDKIRQNLNLKNISSLKKAELVNKLCNLIPAKFKDIIFKLDQSRCDLIKIIINNDGFITLDDISTSKVESLMGYGIVFPRLYNKQKILFMPLELMELFNKIDGYELKAVVRRNTDWISLTYGLLHYYGVMDVWRLMNMVAKLTDREIDFLEYMKVMSFANDFYKQATHTEHGYKDYRVTDPEMIIDEQKKRPDVDYYSFTKQQALKASVPRYIEKTPAVKSFTDFLLEYYDFSKEEVEEMLQDLAIIINTESRPTAMFSYLEDRLQLPSLEMAQELADKLMGLHNNTRLWILKGYTPHELSQREKKHLKPLPAVPFRLDQSDSNIFDIKTGSKIGRNDPCPCGSGNKYKKCCGN